MCNDDEDDDDTLKWVVGDRERKKTHRYKRFRKGDSEHTKEKKKMLQKNFIAMIQRVFSGNNNYVHATL